MSTHSHDDVSRVMHQCVNDEIDPIAAANKIKGFVVRSPSEYEFSAFDKIWSEAIAMAKSWEIIDERHGRLANLFAELNRLRDSRLPWEDFENRCPDDDGIFRDARFTMGVSMGFPPENEVLSLCGFLARLVTAGVATDGLSHLALPCIDLVEPGMDQYRDGTTAAYAPRRMSALVSPERFQVADFWLHACGKQIYASGQAVLDNESGKDVCEAFQFPQAPTGSALPMPLRCQFRHTKAQLTRSWRAWEFLFRSYAGRAQAAAGEEAEEEERMLGLARGMLEYMEMVESEYERAVHGDLAAMEAMSSFAGV